MTPLHERGRLRIDLIESYCPITSTLVVCRTLERIINKKILCHLEENSILSNAKNGVQPRRSSETALGVVVHTASASLDNRMACEMVQLDFERAFDRIDHRLLLQKLVEAGIKGSLLQWLHIA